MCDYKFKLTALVKIYPEELESICFPGVLLHESTLLVGRNMGRPVHAVLAVCVHVQVAAPLALCQTPVLTLLNVILTRVC